MALAIRNISNTEISPYSSEITRRITPNTSTTTTSSSRSSHRRLRTETTTTTMTYHIPTEIRNLLETLEIMGSKIQMAFKKGHIEEALQLTEQFETVWNNTMLDPFVKYVEQTLSTQSTHVKPAIALIMNAALKESKAYYLALLSNPNAIELSDEGFDQFDRGFSEAIELVKELGFVTPKDLKKELPKMKAAIDGIHHFYRGLLNVALNRREEAANDFKVAYNRYLEIDDNETHLEFHFLMRVLEKKLGVEITTTPAVVDPTDPDSLFLARRYEEVLALPEFGDPTTRAMCLAMVGRYEEAVALERTGPELDGWIYFLEGDLKKANQEAFRTGTGIPENLLLLLAIHGFEQN